MTYQATILTSEDFVTTEWSGGKTTQMYIFPEESLYKNLDFKWRISSATVELDESDFTKLINVHRFITTLDNNLKLTHDFKEFIELKPFEIYEFEGDIRTHSYGKVRDFNLMLSNGATGVLKSLSFNHELSLELANDKDEEAYEVFYSFNSTCSFTINNERIILNNNELLIIKLDHEEEISIKLNSNNTTSILHASLRQ